MITRPNPSAVLAGARQVMTRSSGPDPEAIADEASAAYIAAYQSGDAAALACLFTEDADYIGAEGLHLKGRDAIHRQAAAHFERAADRILTIQRDSTRLVTPEVVLEHGTSTSVTDRAQPISAAYTVTYVNRAGAWLIASLLESPLPPSEPGAEALAQLEWLVGDWQASGDGWYASSRAFWALNGRFLTRTFSISREGNDPYEGSEVIGYDLTKDVLRSWTFDSKGSVVESTWNHEGPLWTITAHALIAHGGDSSSQHVLTVIDEAHFSIHTVNRLANGRRLPDTPPVRVERVQA